MNEENTITTEQIEILDRLFDVWKGVSIQTDDDLTALGDIFDEEE